MAWPKETGWLWGQSRANQSPVQFPCYQRILQGNSRNRRQTAGPGCSFPRDFRMLRPYSVKAGAGNYDEVSREYYMLEQGIWPWYQAQLAYVAMTGVGMPLSAKTTAILLRNPPAQSNPARRPVSKTPGLAAKRTRYSAPKIRKISLRISTGGLTRPTLANRPKAGCRVEQRTPQISGESWGTALRRQFTGCTIRNCLHYANMRGSQPVTVCAISGHGG